MKKIWQSALVVTLLGGSTLFADTNIYVGVDYAKASNTNTYEGVRSVDDDNDFSDLSLKVGAGEDGGLKAQLRFDIVSYDEGVFNANKNESLYEIGIDVLKEFEVNKSFFPFIKVGLGYGSMSVEGFSESSIGEVSFNAGVGLSYKALDHFYVMGGVDYVGRAWQDITVGTSTVSTTSSATKLYVGLNYAF